MIHWKPSILARGDGRVIADYGLDGFGETLEEKWTRTDEKRASLRELADVLNGRLLGAAMEDAAMSVLEGEVANTYRPLTDEDVSRGVETQVENRLERNGVDVESLREDFVPHQAVHTYPTKYRGDGTPTT